MRDIEQLEKVQRRYEETARYEKFIIQQTTSSVGFAKLGIAALAPRPTILLQNRFWSGVSQ